MNATVPFSRQELLELQEQIRSESATVQTCRQFARLATDEDLKVFCEDHARTAENRVAQLMYFVRRTGVH